MSVELDGQDVLHHLQRLTVRSDQYKKAGLTTKESAEGRRIQATEASKQTRETLLRAKRLRRGPSEAINAPPRSDVLPESPQSKIQQLVDSINTPSISQKEKLRAISTLRHLLSSDDPPFMAALRSGAGPCLAKALLLKRHTANELKTVFEAAWAITNMAAGLHECVEAVLPAAPLLILLLHTNSSSHIAEQCAWALGNMAGESATFRSRLQANGAVRPLVQLVLAAKGRPEQRVLSTACTAAWALSNMLQGSNNMVKEVFAVNGGAEGLIDLLGTSTSPELLLEVAWVICHATFSQADLNRLVHLGLIKAVMTQVNSCLQEVQGSHEGVHARAGFLRPLLRTVGNVAALGGRDACSELLSSPVCAVVTSLAQVCLTCEDASLQAEAAWLCANMAGMPSKPSIDGHLQTGQETLHQLLPALEHACAGGNTHAQREAVLAINSLSTGMAA